MTEYNPKDAINATRPDSALITLSGRHGLRTVLDQLSTLDTISVRVPLRGTSEEIVSAFTDLSGTGTVVSAVVSLKLQRSAD